MRMINMLAGAGLLLAIPGLAYAQSNAGCPADGVRAAWAAKMAAGEGGAAKLAAGEGGAAKVAAGEGGISRQVAGEGGVARLASGARPCG